MSIIVRDHQTFIYSLQAGNGAGAADENDTLALQIQYRGLTFSVGGDMDLDQHVTLASQKESLCHSLSFSFIQIF